MLAILLLLLPAASVLVICTVLGPSPPRLKVPVLCAVAVFTCQAPSSPVMVLKLALPAVKTMLLPGSAVPTSSGLAAFVSWLVSVGALGSVVSTIAVRVTVAVLPAALLLVTVKVTVPLSGRLSLGTVALQAPVPLAVTVTPAPLPVAMLTPRLASLIPESTTPAVRSAALIMPSPASCPST